MELCSTRRNSVSLEEFRVEIDHDFNRDRHLQFVILKNQKYVGTIYSYNLNRTDGYVFVTIYIARPWRNNGYGIQAVAVFLEYLFREFGLHKVYAEAYSYNHESLNALMTGGFVVEGRFRGHRLYCGERFDLLRLALFRGQVRNFAPIVKKLTGRDPVDWI